jgi:hypothetical protein
MHKLAITGGGGFVAGSVIQQAGTDWEVHPLSGKAPLAERSGLVWHTLDLISIFARTSRRPPER